VVLTQREFTFRADHAVGNMAIRLACGDREVTGQRGSRRSNHNQVTHHEVARAADDAARLVCAGVDLAPTDRLLELGEFLDLKHLAHHDRTAEPLTHQFDGFDFEASVDQVLGDIAPFLPGGNVDEFANP